MPLDASCHSSWIALRRRMAAAISMTPAARLQVAMHKRRPAAVIPGA
jgi:hypothetical protein